jgi:gluconokinase
MIVLLMGVSGSGKTTIGSALAERLRIVFADADDYHSAANKAKMADGHPLNDQDREPWLETLNKLLLSWFEAGKGGVLACSALKDAYRKTLVRGLPTDAFAFVLLDGSKEMIAARLSKRKDHFMNPGLLDSQLATLELPSGALRIVNDRAPDAVVDEIVQHLTTKEM